MKLPVRVLVRTNVIWPQMCREEFANQADKSRPLNWVRGLAKRNFLEVWAQVFDRDFFEFRHDLQTLAERHLRSIPGIDLSIGMDDFNSWYSTDRDEMVFPVDDDDFFSPSLWTLAPTDPSPTQLVMWRQNQYAYNDNGSPILRTIPLINLLTNNWGVRKSFLRRHFVDREAWQILVDHRTAALEIARVLGIPTAPKNEPWYHFEFKGEGVKFLDGCHSLSAKHVGSLTMLREVMTNENALDRLRGVKLSTPVQIPSHLQWAESQIRELEAVFASCQVIE